MRSTNVCRFQADMPSPAVLASIQFLLGLLAFASAAMASGDVVGILAWLLMLAGAVQLIYASQIERAGRIAHWAALVAGLHVGVGLWLVTETLPDVVGPTFLLFLFFLAEGMIDIVACVVSHNSIGSLWMLPGGLVTMIGTWTMWRGCPSDSPSTLGALVGGGISLTGITCLLLASAIRKHEIKSRHQHRTAFGD